MNIEEAIKELEELKETIKTAFWNERYIYKKVISIDTVLTELGRLSQENKELKQKINDFVEEMRCME